MSYRGYAATLELDPEDNILLGRVQDIEDIIVFTANRSRSSPEPSTKSNTAPPDETPLWGRPFVLSQESLWPARAYPCSPLDAESSRRSASHTLMMDCRVMPSFIASRSRESIIHAGKSTLTRLCAGKGRFALDKSSAPVMSPPLSNCLSTTSAFLE